MKTGNLAALKQAVSVEVVQLGLTSWRRIAMVAALPTYGTLFLTWYFFGEGSPELHRSLAAAAFVPILLFAIAATFRAARVGSSAATRRAWAVIGLGFSAYAFGNLAWFWMGIQGQVVPFPSIADIGFLAFFPLLLLGFGLLPRERSGGTLRSVLDMALVMIGAGVAVWWLVLGPVVAAAGGQPDSTVLVAIAFPIGDTMVLFALLVALLGRLTETPRTVLVLLGVGLGLNIVADLTYARLSLSADYTSGTWAEVVYILVWIVMGTAAAIQGTSSVRTPTQGRPASLQPITFLPYLGIAAVYVPLAVSAFVDHQGDRVLVIGAIVATFLVVVRQVLTARQNASLLSQRASNRANARFQALISNASDVILVTDAAGRISFATPSAEPLFERDAAALEGLSIAELVDKADAPMMRALLGAAAQRPGISAPSVLRVAGTEERWVEMRVSNLLEDSLVSGLVATIHDVTERRAFEQQLEAQALHDPLTGLANRVLLADRVGQALVRSRRSQRPPALLCLDLDDFKRVNDTLGHAAGDELLVEVARRIQATIRGEDTAARLGGDEFSILIEQTDTIDEVVSLAERLSAAFVQPFSAANTSISVGCSIGVHRPERPGVASGDLLRNADIAMYAAKRTARGGHVVFKEAMYDETIELVQIEADIRAALDQGQFRLVYQPIVKLADGSMTGAEALLRWHHPERGLVMPDEFIPLAERSGEIRRIGRWVMEEACRTVGAWNAIGETVLNANVNVSLVQLEPAFVAEVARVLAETGFPANLLVIEITESVFSDERSAVVGILGDLRRLGVRISIDDFGTGYSSLSRLRDLPVDELKIDRAFVTELGGQVAGSVVATIVQLARELSLDTVAEGVEKPQQRDRLRQLGCEMGQGYLFSRPVEAAAIAAQLTAEHESLMQVPAA
ncbi:MAG: EAL domain-containing protein [Chloroflexota bacterium]|nr:EAL domain-containing protein [Chloroflexota bacterium]